MVIQAKTKKASGARPSRGGSVQAVYEHLRQSIVEQNQDYIARNMTTAMRLGPGEPSSIRRRTAKG